MTLSSDVTALATAVGARIKRVISTTRAQSALLGGGSITVSSGGDIKWSARFIVITVGNGSHFATSGFFDIVLPPTNTTVLGVAGSANRNVTAAGITLNAWEALYYVLPIGGASDSLDANFRVMTYTGSFVVPDNWVLLALRSGDTGGGMRLGIGRTVPLSTITTVDNPTPTYEPVIAPGSTGQYWRGDKTWQTLNANAVGLGNVPNVDATNAANITSGTLPSGRLAAPLAALAPLTAAADRIAYYTSASAAAFTDFTAFGRSLVASASNTAARSTLDVYSKSESAALANVVTHHANRYMNTGPSIPNNAATTLLWNVADSLDGFTYNTSTGGFTVPVKGRYMLSAAITWGANTNGYRSVRFAINGTVDRFHNDDAQVSLASSHEAFPIKLAAGDVITVLALQTSGGALTMNSTAAANWVVLSYLGPSA